MDESVQPYFGVAIEDAVYLVCRLAMGFSASTAIANRISKAIVEEACRRVWCEEFYKVVQVDNTYIFGDVPSLKRIQNSMMEVTSECNILVGENSLNTEGLILGSYYNLQEKTVRLSEKFIAKHTGLLEIVVRENVAPVIVWWRVFAILLRVARVLQHSFSFLFQIFRAIRQMACALAHGKLRGHKKFV